DLSAIWQDVKHDPTEQGRREYARHHYITHLYYASEWLRLFDVLNTGAYGQMKMQYDPSKRSYIQDLDLGCQAAVRAGRKMDESVELLPYLWRYTLLRCSLVGRGDNYPLEAFEALMLLKHAKEALSLAELLTKPDYKVGVFILIAKHLARQRGRRQ